MFKKIIPALDWLSNYKKTDLSGDLSAGLIVAIMLIPQGMAYAMLAGLPPVIGLYASTIPLIIYALFGLHANWRLVPLRWSRYWCLLVYQRLPNRVLRISYHSFFC